MKRTSPRASAPFGEADCESELKLLKSEYSKVYFDETPFNAASIDPDTYLIIGRRGSGKTALSQYFSFQKALPNPICIDVDEPAVYQQVLSDLASRDAESREIAIPRLKRIWEYVVWCVIFEHTRQESPDIAAACGNAHNGSVSSFINRVIEGLLDLFKEADAKGIEADVVGRLNADQVERAKTAVLEVAARRPIIVALDTLERYDISNDALMNAMAALIQCAADINLQFSNAGIHLKVFMSGEIFPYLKEEVIQNPSKSIKSPVYLLWRPKDLLRLISWRFFRYLEDTNLLRAESKGSIDWEDPREVLKKMWQPYFGVELTNGLGLRERTFAYVLRHTQMRPRQLILICNAVVRRALQAKRFPSVSAEDIRQAVKDAERDLAVEIINSFSSVYPKLGAIVDALMKMPMIFMGNELDKRASQSASAWPRDAYSPVAFRRLVAELGIVGRVRRRNDAAQYLDADFDYSLADRLTLTHRDECVIHPMFYGRLNVQLNVATRVMPFSTEREARDADGDFA
jgi:hypothetical protein